MAKLLLAAGTSEAKDLASELLKAGYELVLTVVSDWGEQVLKESLRPFSAASYRLVQGRLDQEAFVRLCQEESVEAVVDATHPFARIAGITLKAVADELKLPYLRYQRALEEETELLAAKEGSLYLVDDCNEAALVLAELLKEDPSRIGFLTVGSKEAAVFAKTCDPKRLVPRVLPVEASLKSLIDAGYLPSTIIAQQGPFSEEENRAQMSRYANGVLVTKLSGARGGFQEKLSAAKARSWPVVVVRPPRTAKSLSPEAFLERLDELLKQDKKRVISEEVKVPRLLLTAPKTGSGKTSITAALLLAFSQKGYRVKAFKAGADAIDTALLTAASGQKAENLDSVLYTKESLEALIRDGAKNSDLTLIEGAMGLFDGLLGSDPKLPAGSAAKLAVLTRTPILLLVDAKGRAQSLLAEVLGLLKYQSQLTFAGLILNRTSKRIYEAIKEDMEKATGLPLLGYIEDNPALKLPEPIDLLLRPEQKEALACWEEAASKAMENLDLARLYELSKTVTPLRKPAVDCFEKLQIKSSKEEKIKIALASDSCFSKDDPQNIRLLKKAGFELLTFSPLRDSSIPEAELLWLGEADLKGRLDELLNNQAMLHSLEAWWLQGRPLIALGESSTLFYKGANERGFLKRLSDKVDLRKRRFGYCELCALKDGPLLKKGESLLSREYVGMSLVDETGDFTVRKLYSEHLVAGGSCSMQPLRHVAYGRISFLQKPSMLFRLRKVLEDERKRI